jgi:carbon-monoxide dehydrogenase medium subunit
MQDFVYHRPSSVEEAEALFAACDDAVFMSGGMTLVATMKQGLAAPSDVIDLGRLVSRDVSVQGSCVTIGAGASHAEVAGHAGLADALPALAALAGGIGDAHVRNRGTLGGSIANNDPAADYPAALMALDAVVTTSSRTMPASEFFVDMFETGLAQGEIVTSVTFSMPRRAAYAKFSNPASHYAMAGVLVADHDGDMRVAVTGAGPCVFRQAEMEAALAADFSPGAVSGIMTNADDLNEDIHATAAYRVHLVTVMAKRAVAGALAGVEAV